MVSETALNCLVDQSSPQLMQRLHLTSRGTGSGFCCGDQSSWWWETLAACLKKTLKTLLAESSLNGISTLTVWSVLLFSPTSWEKSNFSTPPVYAVQVTRLPPPTFLQTNIDLLSSPLAGRHSLFNSGCCSLKFSEICQFLLGAAWIATTRSRVMQVSILSANRGWSQSRSADLPDNRLEKLLLMILFILKELFLSHIMFHIN